MQNGNGETRVVLTFNSGCNCENMREAIKVY
jgi:hypothetical protein